MTKKRNPPIHTPGGTIHDDKPPHIDDFGLAMIGNLTAQVERLVHDGAGPGDVEEIHRHLLEIVARYETTEQRYQMIIV